MTNAHFTRLDQYRDLESLNMFHQRVEQAHIQSAESMMDALAKRSRDNARTPMQWDDSTYAGFTAADAPKEPWISVNPNHTTVNAQAQQDDPDSVFSFFKQLIALRHDDPVVSAGDWHLLDESDPQVYACTRSLGDERLLVAVNLSGKDARIPDDTAAALAAAANQSPDIVLTSYDPQHSADSLAARTLSPWEAVTVRL